MLKTRLPNSPQNLTIATTGASGSIFVRQLLLAADRDTRIQSANFIASDSALRVMAEELGLRGRNNLVSQLLGHSSRKIHQQANADIGARSEEHTSELQSPCNLVCRLLLEKTNTTNQHRVTWTCGDAIPTPTALGDHAPVQWRKAAVTSACDPLHASSI